MSRRNPLRGPAGRFPCCDSVVPIRCSASHSSARNRCATHTGDARLGHRAHGKCEIQVDRWTPPPSKIERSLTPRRTSSVSSSGPSPSPLDMLRLGASWFFLDVALSNKQPLALHLDASAALGPCGAWVLVRNGSLGLVSLVPCGSVAVAGPVLARVRWWCPRTFG